MSKPPSKPKPKSGTPKKPKQPVEQRTSAIAFFAERGFEVGCLPAIWHIHKVGHLINIDLERICRDHDMSIADMHLLAAIRVEHPAALNASSLAQRLNVSNGALSTRLAKLEAQGWLRRKPSKHDRRAIELTMTAAGIKAIDNASADIGERASFANYFERLPQQDREHLVRILGDLHNQLDRDFLSASRGKI